MTPSADMLEKVAKAKRPKYGGRKKGTPNKKDSEAAQRAKKIIDAGLTPLEYLLSVMRDPKVDQVTRIEAAKSAAPYVHPKLQAITLSNPDGSPMFDKIERRIVDPQN